MFMPSFWLAVVLTTSSLIAQYDWDYDEAIVIMECESSGNAEAVGDDGASIGLYQIAWDNIWGRNEYPQGIREKAQVPEGMTVKETIAWLKVPENNIRVAYWTYKLRDGWSGWGGWSCSRML